MNILLEQAHFIQELNGYMSVNNSCLSGREKREKVCLLISIGVIIKK